MKKFKLINLTIRNKLLLIYILCVLLPIILTDAIILHTVRNNYQAEKEKEIQYLMERMEYNLTETIRSCFMIMNNLDTDWLLNEVLNKQYNSYLEYYEEYYKLLQFNKLSYNYNNGTISKLQIFTDNETILDGGKIGSIDSVKEEDWYTSYKTSGQKMILYAYYDAAKRNVPGSGTSRTISIISELDYFGYRGIEKILKIDINYNAMWKDILNEKMEAQIYVRNQDYILFSNRETDNSMNEFAPADSIVFEGNVVTREFTTGRQNWEIVVITDDTDFWTIIMGNKGLLSLVLLNIFLPSTLIYFVGKSISKRLSLVASHMDQVKTERFEEIGGISGEDEIGDLIHSYNLMIRKIRYLIQVVYKDQAEKQALELSRKQAELKAVQSQVNPHYLFNTLESVRMRSVIKGEEETADIIGEMAVLFRKSMMWGSDFVSIEEELSYVEKYIKIQKYRFGNKINYEHYIMDGCKQYLVPKLGLSTFVENACIHGIEATGEDGVISLNITKNNDYLFIEISDNGKGIEPERLKEIRMILSSADSKMLNEAKSTGILNAVLRFMMYYEGNVVFSIDSAPENGTDIIITIPLETLGNTLWRIKNEGEKNSSDKEMMEDD